MSGLPGGNRNNNGNFNNIGNNGNWWSSSENNTNNAWNRNLNYNNGNANRNNNNKENGLSVRCLRDLTETSPRQLSRGLYLNQNMQIDLSSNIDYQLLAEEVFTAYFDCRKNKRNTLNALKFEKHLEKNVFALVDDIYNGSYALGRSIVFIVDKPVKREIFAADFRDRVVHHWLINKLNPLFENIFIKDSYACRIGKGTHYGVKRADAFIKACSENYTSDCYILKLDVQGFFMYINRKLLYKMLEQFIHKYYTKSDKALVLEIVGKIVFNNPINNCIIKGDKKDWAGLPNNKSMFHSPPDCGLTIGNLTSQVFANFYMHLFDEYVTNELDIKYYGRYVDDFIIVHHDRGFLKTLIPKLSRFLLASSQLTLHPKKIYLQHYSKGVKFLGTVIKPNRIYIANRTKGNFYNAIDKHNRIIHDNPPNGLNRRNKPVRPSKEEKAAFLSSMNSYLGIMKHYKSYKLRKKIIAERLSAHWFNHVFLTGGITKFVLKVRPVKKKRLKAAK